jgi:Ca2+-binding RTX toxin-like protein
MTTQNSPTATTATTWTLDSYTDYRYLDADLSGIRFTQGIVWNADAGEWITSWQYGMARLSEDFAFLQTTGSIDTATFDITTGIPQELADQGFDHIGDIDYYDGKVYISLDSEAGDYQNGHVAVLNASDLSYTGELYELVGDSTNEHDDVASWVAVDGENGVGYGKEWQNGNTINVYNLDDWSFQGTLEMDQSLKKIQGAKVLDGMMYMAAHNDTRSVYSVDLETGHVEELFQLPTVDNSDVEVEGIEARLNDDGEVEITVELIIQPDGDNYADDYTRVFTYTLGDGANATVAHTWTVTAADDTTDADDMALTLREAIAKADAGDTITFDSALSGQTITLADAELALSQNITIEGDLDGDGDSDITIDGGALSSVIHVTGGTATLNGLVVLHADDTEVSSIAVDDGATLAFSDGATMTPGTSDKDVMTGTAHWDGMAGGAGTDTLKGLGGNDLLYGQAGDDVLTGGAGTDTLVGGKGDDTYTVEQASDVVSESKAGGDDTVRTSIVYALGDFVENLKLTGSADVKATGNAQANTLTGNSGANLISGGAGKDVLWGGADGDRFIFAAGESHASKAKADMIMDFRSAAGDRIDLHLIDADEGRAGNQKFHFIGTDGFGGDAGELRFEKTGSDTYILADTDGNGTSDFTLHLDDAMAMRGVHFLL